MVRPKQGWFYLHSKVNCKRLGSTYCSGQGRNHFLSVLVTILHILTSLSSVWQLLVTPPSIRTYEVYTSLVQNTQFLNDHAAARDIPSRTPRTSDRQQPNFGGLVQPKAHRPAPHPIRDLVLWSMLRMSTPRALFLVSLNPTPAEISPVTPGRYPTNGR